MTLKSFVLVGSILSHDDVFATVSFNLNPAVNGGPSIAVMPVEAIPCDIFVGKKVFVVKSKKEEYPVITCGIEDEDI